MSHVEIIEDSGVPLAYIIKANWMPTQTEFVTPTDFGQQLGMIVYGAGSSIQPHLHLPVTREVKGTSEVIVVRKGSCFVDLYNFEKKLITSRFLNLGDIVLLINGGHGFRMEEDCVLFEVKQGPYMNNLDKERF